MAKTTSDFLIERLQAWGVNRVYGYPGDGINGIMGALERAEGAIDFVQVRHEEMAAFMACAHAKFTGEVGVCMATSGPGAIHLLNGLYDAKMDHQPVVAIVGQASRLAMGGSYQQEVDLQNLFKDVASDYCQTAMAPAALRHLSRSRLSDRAGAAQRYGHHHSERSTGGGVRRSAAQALHGSFGRRLHQSAHRPRGCGFAARGRGAECGDEGGHAHRRGHF
jgi:thiamine pyrophosphate-dependent acetolactate synthase large subunit-like protein